MHLVASATIPIDLHTPNGETVLSLACREGRVDIVREVESRCFAPPLQFPLRCSVDLLTTSYAAGART